MPERRDARETIVARATPPAPSGLAVVRLSGPRAIPIARELFVAGDGSGPRATGLRPRRATVGLIRDPRGGETVDQVVAVVFPGPRSYTGEDVVEFTCHGGILPARLVVEACLAAGARPAAAGEFTRRAFLNGRLSLEQAEAVADLIHAESRLAARGALAQLRGGLRRELEQATEPLRRLAAELTGSLEFEELDDVVVPASRIAATLAEVDGRLGALLGLGDAGRRLRDGVQVVVAGPPNVGKSSLFNALLGEQRALVDDIAGTTRDSITARLVHRDCLLVLHDTAGLRRDGERIERLGMDRTRHLLAVADMVLLLCDLTGDVETDPGLLDEVPRGTPLLVVGTKADLLDDTPPARWRDRPVLATSAVTGAGLDELRDAMLAAADEQSLRQAAELGVVLNERHRRRLREARQELQQLCREVEGGATDEVVATLLGGILTRLEEISGRAWTERLLDDVFSRFCVGK